MSVQGAKAARVVAELDFLAALLDSRWRIPGTSIRFGLDALVGLVPSSEMQLQVSYPPISCCEPEAAAPERFWSP